MSVSEKLMGIGSFSVALKSSAPVETVETIDAAGHILIFQQRVDPTVMSDADMRAAAAYVGVVIGKPRKNNLSIRGHSLIWWLGDGQGRGLILRNGSKQVFVGEDFDQAITDVLGVTNSPLNAGSLETPAGTFTQTFDLVTQRRAIEEICAAFGAEYRVNSDWTVDAGASGFLFNSTPSVVIARHFSGKDPLVTGLPTKLITSDQDIEEWVATAIVAAEGTGDTLITAEDTVSPIPFLDPLGGDFHREFVFNTPSLPSGEAAARATELMNEFSVEQKTVKLNLEDFHVSGDFEVGDLVYVWDTDHKLYDTDNEITFRGQVLNPIAIRVVGVQWRVIEGMGVLYRDKNGVYTDLTDHMDWERSTGTRIEVGASSRNLINQESEALDARITTDPDGNDTLTPNAPAHSGTPWATTTYTDDEGARTSQIVATWTEPTNTDSSVVTDGDHYIIRWRRSGDSDYSYFVVPWGTEVAIVNNLVPGGIYEISVEAVDTNGNHSGYATDQTVTAAAQVGVPSTPATPTVAGNTLNVQVSHDLTKSGGGNLEDDLDHLVVYGDASSGFTPSNANRLGALMATKAHIDLGITVIGTFPFPDTTNRFFVVTAVNKAGGESAKSAEASVSATLIDTQHITNLAVTEAIIDDLAVARAKIALLAVDTAQIEALAVTTAKIDLLAVDTAQIEDLAVERGKISLLAVDSAQIESAAITNAKIDALAVDTAEIAALAVTNAKINDLNAVKITAGTLDADRIGAGTITAAKLNVSQLDAITANMGTLTVDETLTMGAGGILRTASSGTRLELTNTDNEFLSIYNASERTGTLGWSSTLSRVLLEGVNGNSVGVRGDALVLSADVTGWTINAEVGGTLSVGVGGAAGNMLLEVDAAGSGEIAFHTLGSERMSIENNGDVKFNKLARTGDGSAALPGWSFIADPNTGMYRVQDDEIGFTTNGATRVRIWNEGLLIHLNGSASQPSIGWAGDSSQDTGFYLAGANQIGITAGGTLRAAVTTTELQVRGDNGVALTDYGPGTTATSGAGTDAAWVHLGSGVYDLRRFTSGLKYKKYVDYDVDYLADYQFKPARWWSVEDERWFYGPIGDDMARLDPLIGIYNEDGSVEGFHRPGWEAIVMAKLNRLEAAMEAA